MKDTHTLRILALLTDGFGGSGGIARYNADLMTALASSSEVEQLLILPRLGSCEDRALPHGVVQRAAIGGRIRYAATATATGVRAHFDVVFCGHLSMVTIAAATAAVRRVPLWLQLHGIEAWGRPTAAIRRAVEHSSLVTTVSRYTRRRFLQWSRLSPERVRVLPNTFESRFEDGPKSDRLVRRHSLDNRKVLLTVSRLSSAERYKGHDRLIAALPRIMARIPNVVYLIVGDGDDRGRLEDLAQRLGIAHAVTFTGFVAPEELPDYYRCADAFAMPSTGEGFGIVFLEAAAVGLAVIGGNCDGSLDALADGAIGKVVDPHDAEQLIDAICESLYAKGNVAPDAVSRFSNANFQAYVGRLVSTLKAQRSGTSSHRQLPPPEKMPLIQ